MSKQILLVDDDALLRTSLSFSLTQAGYRVYSAASAAEGLALAQKDPPSLILLDVGLPGLDGFQALDRFRDIVASPVILLTARADEMDQARGLSEGAEDYVTKPFSFTVLLARINLVLRRSNDCSDSPGKGSVLEVGDLRINPDTHQVLVGNRPVELRRREFDVLRYLAERAEAVVPADQVLEQVWGSEFVGEPQVVYVTISRLREKLEDNPEHPRRIISLRGIGYKLMPVFEKPFSGRPEEGG